MQQRGYAAGAPSYEGGVPSFIVECNSVLTCPGSLELGKCPGSNSGIACVDCLPDHYQAAENGGCDGGLEFTKLKFTKAHRLYQARWRMVVWVFNVSNSMPPHEVRRLLSNFVWESSLARG